MVESEFLIKFVLFLIRRFVVFIKLIPIYLECILEFLNIKQKPLKSIRNKVILVTGGGQGLGKETAIGLARYDNQCKIVIADINLEAAKETVDYLRINMYTKAYAFYVDVTDYDSVVELHKRIVAEIGIVDILINNAGLVTLLSLMEGSWTDLEKVIDVNFKSQLLTTRIFLTDMIQQKSGHIVGISSMSGSLPGPYRITYSATKAGINCFMKCLSTELLLYGHSDYIKTSLISPYFILTRPEIKDKVQSIFLYSALKPSEAGNATVDAILRDAEEMFIPKSFTLLKLQLIFPFNVYKRFVLQE